MSYHQNITRIKAVYNALEEIVSEVVFLGGATVSLYADRPATEARPTDDVDILIEVANYKGYADIEERLHKKGFSPDQRSNVICRYVVKGIIVDVMPTDEAILGFSNRWYQKAFSSAILFSLEEGYDIRILRPELFIATKLEAFKGRGGGDGRTSHDFEDIVHVLNNRGAIWEEIEAADYDVKNYLKETFSALVNNKYFEEWVGANLDYHEQKRVVFILEKLKSFIEK